MEEVRQQVQEEGREARNLVAFHVSVDAPARISRKPPRSTPLQPRRAPPRPPASRLRSASAGRDKRSELRARYWALLFGDLQRAVGEIYNTVEAHENLSECQEVILVLENYTRDFKALCEWFRLKWEYDHTPPPQRPQSLAWEIRKTDFVRPESRRAHSVKSSPSVSGKNSPLLSGHNTPSGKNSPNLTGKTSPGSGKLSPRVSSVTSPKANVEFFSNKLSSKIATKPEPKLAKDLGKQLSDIKERVADDNADGDGQNSKSKSDKVVKVNKEVKIPDDLSSQAKATIAKLNVMECAFLEKQLIENAIKNDNMLNKDRDKEIEHNTVKSVEEPQGKESPKVSPVKSEDNFGDVSNESSSKSLDEGEFNKDNKTDKKDGNKVKSSDKDKVLEDKVNTKPTPSANLSKKDDIKTKEEPKKIEDAKDEAKKGEFNKQEPKIEAKPRPAYSQAAAKPKVAVPTKVEPKTAQKTIALTRSKTVVEIRPSTNITKTQKYFPKRNQTNKCSYPFNLTTGRTSIFDSTSTKVKKPVNKIGSGDTKAKAEPKKLIKRPSSLNISQADKDKHLENIKDYDEYSSSETVVTQIDMSRIESSESLKTLIAEDAQLASDVAYTLEVLNIDKNDNEGWLTVKSRRLSRESKKQPKSHWSNRFHQPSATTSLPTLNMIESPKQENKPIIAKPEDRAKSEQPVTPKVVKVNASPKPNKTKNTSMIRQKSDVTGLKTRSARNKAVNKKSSKEKDKKADSNSELTKNRLHSSLESLTGLSRSQESTEEAFDFDKWKAEFKSTFRYLDDDDQISNHNEILKSADPSEMSEIAEMTSQIEENERKISLALDFQSEVDQRKLSEEEDFLNRQIMELQQVSDVDLDTETDDTETDAELGEERRRRPVRVPVLEGSLEDQYEAALEGMSWAERMDTLVALEALVARDPGRAQQLHAKLSQGIKRRGSFQDTLRRLQAKQARAEQHRQELQTERTKKIHMLLTRVEEVKFAKNQLIDEKRNRMERRLQKAAENRDQHLKDIVRKAHDEEEKLREIAFIKQLEAENRRHEFLDQCRSHTTRLRQLRRERLTKLEQKAAREAAVGARRAALEAARKLHVETLLERRRERDDRTARRREEKRQERDDAAREKAEGVKSRLSALAAAAELEVDALRSRIKDKQDASEQRLAEHLQAIRSKATGPRQMTTSESQDQATKEEENEIENITQEKKDKDRQKALRKRARKLRQKLLIAGQEYEEISAQDLPQMNNNKISKILNQINNILTSVQNHERCDNNKKKEVTNGIDKSDNDKPVNGVEKKKAKKKKAPSEEKQLTSEVVENDEITNSKKSKKKKNKSESDNDKKQSDKSANDRPKLSKTPSVASSMSDMSKISGKSDKKMANIDWGYFEKVMNELNRAMDKIDKSSQDCLLHGMKIISQLLGLSVEKEENGLQVTIKSISTAVHIISRIVSLSPGAAALFVNTNCGTHVARLLAGLLEKDQDTDKAEQQLAKQCADCLTIALESVFATTMLYEEYSSENNEQKRSYFAAMRRRAHCLISYLSLSGIFSHDYQDSVRDSIQSLLTICAILCSPCDIDTGQDRSTAVSNLRTNITLGLCGARSELTSLYESSGEDIKAARVARLLRSLAELDHGIVQEAFGEGSYPLEFKAAVASLLSDHAPSDREPEGKNHGGTEATSQSEAISLDLIVLIGMVVVNNTQHQETICDNWSAIRTLCNLPANWIVSTHSHVLLPTLAALAQYAPASAIIAGELSKEMIEEYIESPEAQSVKLVQLIKEGRKKNAQH